MPLSEEQLAKNFAEIAPPLTNDAALLEANQCLYCHDAPCTIACPTHIDVPAFIKKIVSGMPLARMGVTQDIVNTALFLLSDEAGWVTGQTWCVDGGAVLKAI